MRSAQIDVERSLLCDAHDVSSNDKVLWGYVSAILHRTSKQDVLSELRKQDESENAVLDRLKELVGEDVSAHIVPLPETVDFSVEGFSEFERLVAMREEINGPSGGSSLPAGTNKQLAKDLLDDLVHMNDAIMDCIDPYRYPVWPPALFMLLER